MGGKNHIIWTLEMAYMNVIVIFKTTCIVTLMLVKRVLVRCSVLFSVKFYTLHPIKKSNSFFKLQRIIKPVV